MRFYWNNDSFPELRDIHRRWARTVTWWRAIAHATRSCDFWAFVTTQAACLLALVLIDLVVVRAAGFRGDETRVVHIAFALAALVLFCYLQVSLGGDMMRRHLRAVSREARYACPACGHSLFGHLDGAPETVRCPECAATVERKVLEPPFRIPGRFRVFPPWRRGG